METLFDSINLDATSSADSTIDYKLLDTTCDHQILNDNLAAITSISFSGIVYSGSAYYGHEGDIYSGGIDPDATFLFRTTYPLADQNILFYEQPNSNYDAYITEEFVIASGVTTIATQYRFTFPPRPNSTSARLKTTSVDEFGETQIIYFPFTNYTLASLNGIVKFTEESDFTSPPSTVEFKYIGDIKPIFPKSKDMYTNWEFLGYDIQNRGVFRFYGRAFQATMSGLIGRYMTSIDKCPKCGTTGILNDLDMNRSTNKFRSVYDFSKLIQDFFKRFLTRRTSNPFDSTDGSQVATYIGVAKNDLKLVDTLIKTEIISLVNQIRRKQNIQAINQGLSLAEQIQQINSVVVTKQGLTDVDVSIEVQSQSQATGQIKTSVEG